MRKHSSLNYASYTITVFCRRWWHCESSLLLVKFIFNRKESRLVVIVKFIFMLNQSLIRFASSMTLTIYLISLQYLQCMMKYEICPIKTMLELSTRRKLYGSRNLNIISSITGTLKSIFSKYYTKYLPG